MPEAALLHPIIALVAGILIFIVPRLLNYVVAIYLILIGILGILPHRYCGRSMSVTSMSWPVWAAPMRIGSSVMPMPPRISTEWPL
jgi:hypothetical protein